MIMGTSQTEKKRNKDVLKRKREAIQLLRIRRLTRFSYINKSKKDFLKKNFKNTCPGKAKWKTAKGG